MMDCGGIERTIHAVWMFVLSYTSAPWGTLANAGSGTLDIGGRRHWPAATWSADRGAAPRPGAGLGVPKGEGNGMPKGEGGASPTGPPI
eukprot:scaffold7381_cov310-Pinguiococcus_pyrenoidosus.AAC.10